MKKYICLEPGNKLQGDAEKRFLLHLGNEEFSMSSCHQQIALGSLGSLSNEKVSVHVSDIQIPQSSSLIKKWKQVSISVLSHHACKSVPHWENNQLLMVLISFQNTSGSRNWIVQVSLFCVTINFTSCLSSLELIVALSCILYSKQLCDQVGID